MTLNTHVLSNTIFKTVIISVLLCFSGIKLFAQAPTITSFSPSSGSVGSLVTITGTNLNNPTSLTIGGVSAIPISNTGTELVAMVMPGATSGLVSITTANGTVNGSTNFTVNASQVPNTQQGNKLVGTGSVGTNVNQGSSVALSADGNTAVIGGAGDNNSVGALWVYTRSGNIWTQQGNKLTPTGNTGAPSLGFSTAISADGNTIVVGGWNDNVGAGAVWVFTRTAGVWTQQGNKLVGTNGSSDAEQGFSVDISADGNTIVSGGWNDNGSVGAVWVFTRTAGVWTQQGNKLVGSGAVGNAFQGRFVAISADGNTVISGGYSDNANQGAAWVFTRNSNVWTQEGSKLTATGNTGAARFGSSVALSADGNTAAIGGFLDNTGTGATWIFSRIGTTWSQQGNKLVGSGNVFTSGQGQAVAISEDGNIVLVGGFMDNGSVGAVWRFQRTGNTWNQVGNKLLGSGNVGNARFGQSLGISSNGNIAIIGGPSDNVAIGAAWVFTAENIPAPTISSFSPTSGSIGSLVTINGTNLMELVTLNIGGVAAIPISNNGNQIVALVMPGATTGSIAIATPGGSTTASSNFTINNSAPPLAAQGNRLVGTSGSQGTAVSISADGNTAVVGGSSDNSQIGSLWVFVRSNGVWTQQGNKLTPTGNTGAASLGFSTAISADGNTIVAGGAGDASSVGAAWIFVRNGTTWSQQGNKLVGTGRVGNSRQGSSVAISADGNTVVVAGETDNNLGATWVFTRTGTTWRQQGNKLVGTNNSGNSAQGRSVAISADGNTILVGGPDDNSLVGAAWVFVKGPASWVQQGNKLTPTGNVGQPRFGGSVSLSANGNIAAIGGSGDNANNGATWIFTRTGTAWLQAGNKLVGVGNIGAARQGRAVALSAAGNMLLIAGTSDNNFDGALWVFSNNGTAWSQAGDKVTVSDLPIPGAQLGFAAAISADGNTAFASANSGGGASWAFSTPPPPAITSFTPSSGSVGSLVTITGTNINNLTSINIGGVAAIPLQVSATQVLAMVMPGATTGVISIVNGGGSVNSASNFTIVANQIPNTPQGNKLVGTGTTASSQQGTSVAISADGNTAVVGAAVDNSLMGCALVYVRTGNSWVQQGNKLVGTGAVGTNIQQGIAVAISADGNTIVVGGHTDNSSQGAIWVFTRSGSVWTQQGNKLTASGAVGSAFLGRSVAISADGNTIAAGGIFDNSGVGATWIFTRTGTNWSQQGNKLVGTGSVGAAQQGISVALSADGNTVVTGGSGDNNDIGAAWIFTRNGVTWSQQGNKLVGSGLIGTPRFGYSVAISANGNTMAVGALTDNATELFGGRGAVIIFEKIGSAWNQQGPKLVPTLAVLEPGFGYGVALSADGNTLIASGPEDNGIGAHWAFKRTGSTWNQEGGKFFAEDYTKVNPLSPINQGIAIAISADGNTFISGSNIDNLSTGAAWIYAYNPIPPPSITSFSPASGGIGSLVTINGNNFYNYTNITIGNVPVLPISTTNTQIVAMVMPGTVTGSVNVTTVMGSGSGNNFTITASQVPNTQQGNKLVGTANVGAAQQGFAVAINADGNTAIVGGNADNNNVGAAWIYTRNNGVWSQQAKLIGTGSVGASPGQGTTVAISADGNTVAVGAPSASSNTGLVWIYRRNGTSWVQLGNNPLMAFNSLGSATSMGSSLALNADGTILVFGGRTDGSSRGSAFVYLRTNRGFTPLQKLIGTGNSGASRQGTSVDVSANGNTIVVGGSGDNSNRGAVWVFERDPDSYTWSQQGNKLVGTGFVGNSQQGASVKLSADGNTLIVGGNTDNSNQGAAWIFTRTGTTWTQQGNKLVGTGNIGAAQQGSSVSINAEGNIALMGGATDNTSLGAAWLFSRSGTTWNQQGNKIVGTGNVGSNVRQAASIGLSSNGLTAILGGANDNSNQGAAWVFVYAPPPSIAVTSSLSAFSACTSVASTEQSFTVSGSNLTNDITITAPTGFEVSSTSGNGFSTSITLTQTSGTLNNTTVYVRMAATATGNPSGNITIASSGATSQSIAVNGTVRANPIPVINTSRSPNLCTGTSVNLFSSTGPGNGVHFRGNDERLQLPMINNVRAISMWVNISATQQGPFRYLIDARGGLHAGWANSNDGISTQAWTKLYVNGVSVPVSWNNLPTNQWAHIYLEANTNFNDDITFFARFGATSQGIFESLVVRADELAIWSSPKTEAEVQSMMNAEIQISSASDLLAYYNFNQSSGTTVIDQTGNGRTANVVVGSAWEPSGAPIPTYSNFIWSPTNANTSAITVSTAGNYTVTATDTSGCVGTSSVTVVTVNDNPTITLGTINSVMSDEIIFSIPYSATTGNANQYSITVGSTNAMPNFTAVTNASLTPNQINVSIPASTPGSYNFNLTIRNSLAGCVSSNIPFTLTITQAVPKKWFVKPSASGLGDGRSWANASSDLQAIINGASKLDTIWVAAGTYVPTRDVNGSTANGSPRTRTFYLKDSVLMYGGFTGNEAFFSQRNVSTNTTILSGDIAGNDGANFGNYDDNTYHVVVGYRLSAKTEFDGFTIRGGNANDNSSFSLGGVFPVFNSSGGGMYNVYGNAIFNNLIFTANRCTGEGGGAMINGSDDFNPSAPTLNNCRFINNISTTTYAGAIYSFKVNATFNNCLFQGNSGFFVGGANFQFRGNSTYNSCVFVENTSPNYGGAISHRIGTLFMNNCVIANNTAGLQGAAIYGVIENRETSGQIVNTTIYGNRTTGTNNNATGFAMIGEQFTVTNSIFWNNTGGFTGGREIFSGGNGININNSVVVRGNSNYNSSLNNNESGNPNFKNVNNLIGNDGIWGTSDDGLNLSCGSSAFSIGDANPRPTDIIGTTRPQFSAASAGAYEPTSMLVVPPPTGLAVQDFTGIIPTVANLQTTSGTNIKWYSSSTSTTELATSTPLISGNKYYATQNPGGECGESIGRLEVLVSFGPVITITGTLTSVNTTYGAASPTPTNFTISGNSLTDNIVVTAPVGYEVSTSIANGYSNSINLIPSAGTLVSTNVYVRLAATTAVGIYTGNVSIATVGASTSFLTTVSSSVIARDLTITASNVNKTYGSVLSNATGSTAFTSSGLQNSETIGSVSLTYGTGSAATAAVGTYTGSVTPSAATGGTFTASNYNITYTSGNIIVGQAPLTITANNVNKTYGSTLSNTTGSTAFTSNGLQNSETIGSVSLTYGTGSAATAAVGTYTGSVTPSAATGGTFTASNYNITYASGNITVGQAALTITANNANKTYGSTLSNTTGSTAFTSSGLQNSETIGSVSLTYGTGSAATAAVGTYTGSVTPSAATGGTFTASNYNITYTSGNIIVGQAALTITANNINKTYGSTLSNTTGSTAFTSSGLQNSETIGSVSLTYGIGSAATAAVGTYTGSVTPSDATGGTFTPSNYNITYVSGNIIVGQAALTITANNASKTYGAVASLSQFTAIGLLNSDVVSTVNLSSTGSVATAAVGNYPITASSATGTGLANYTITYNNGTLTVNPAALTITANNASKTYGTVASLSQFTATGLLNSDVVSTVNLSSTGSPATAAVGTYAITASSATGTGLSNYTIAYNNGTLTVNPAALTITANNASKTYGAVASLSQFTATGLLNSDAVSTVTLSSTGSPATAAVGTYAITAANATGTGLANYTITYNNGTLTVNPAALTITATNASKTYGAVASLSQFTATGLLNSDAVSAVTLSSTGSPATAAVGTYPITASNATGTGLANYTITYNNGTLTVNPAALTITANNASKTYGAVASLSQFTATGLLNSDAVSTVNLSSTGTLATAAVGTYAITAANATGTGLANYTITYNNGTLTVNPAALTITANNASKTYGAVASLSQFTATGLLNSDAVSTVNLSSTGSPATAALGTYPITASSATGTGLANYTITYNNGTLTVNPAALTITANNASKTYGSVASLSQFTATGLLNSDAVSAVSLSSTGTPATAAVGTYAITASNATGTGLSNYTITYNNGTLTVNPAALTITASNANKFYGLTFNPTQFTTSGLLNTDVVSAVTLTSSGTPATVNVGTYSIVASNATGSGLSNYSITYNNGTLTVLPISLTITAANQTKCQGVAFNIPTDAWGVNGLVNADRVNTVNLFSAGAGVGATAGTYNIVPSGATGVGLSNYTITYINGTFTVNALPTVTASTSSSSVSRGRNVTLTATGSGSFAWSPAFGLSSPNTATTEARVVERTTYTVRLTGLNGCTNSASVTVDIVDDLFVEPSIIFTPNGDGINDRFVIKNIDVYPQNRLQVFDRAGRLLYEQNNYSNNWDGIVNGKPLQKDNYFYVLSVNNKIVKRGTLTLVR